MTPNLIELIVQAVMAEIIMNKKQWQIEPMSSNFYSQNDIVDSLRTALASIPEMPQVDLGELIERVKAGLPDECIHSYSDDKFCDCVGRCMMCLDKLLTSPPTKTE